MSGPPPNPNSRRRNDKNAWRTVPARCDVRAPAWPLAGKPARGQADLWRHLWTLPAAHVWHEQNSVRMVARYAIAVLRAETGVTTAADNSIVIRLEDGLLITPAKLHAAHILVSDDAPAVETTTVKGVASLDDRRAARLAS